MKPLGKILIVIIWQHDNFSNYKIWQSWDDTEFMKIEFFLLKWNSVTRSLGKRDNQVPFLKLQLSAPLPRIMPTVHFSLWGKISLHFHVR